MTSQGSDGHDDGDGQVDRDAPRIRSGSPAQDLEELVVQDLVGDRPPERRMQC